MPFDVVSFNPKEFALKTLSIILALLLASCATPVYQQEVELFSKNICCKTLDEFEYQTANLSKGVILKFDYNSPVYDFGGGKTYFSAIELPPNLATPYVSVESFFNGSLIGQYFEPIFLVLNENYEGLEAFSLELRFLESNIFTNPTAHMAGYFKLVDKAKYLVVFTGELKSTAPVAELASSKSIVMIGNAPIVYSNEGRSIRLERSPTGSIRLKLIEGD